MKDDRSRREALAALEQVRREFLRLEIAYDTALVTLELAVLLLRAGRTAEVRKLAGELLPMFQAQNVSREALATVRLFCQAVDEETLTVEMAQRFLEDLRRVGA